MKRRHLNKKFLLLLLVTSLQGCAQTNTSKFETYDQFRTQKIEERDSLLVFYTVKEWGKQMWDTWAVRTDMYKLKTGQVEYFLGGVFYSPDKTKMLAWVGEKMPNAPTVEVYNKEKPSLNRICPVGGDTVYTMTAVIGFRYKINQPWKLYPFDQEQATCFGSKDEVINVLGQYYFGQMKKHQMYRMMQTGKRKGHKELQAYGYNLQDEGFWNRCWLWQKDTVGSYGLYPFQIKGYDYNGDKCTQQCADPFIPPKIDYPDNIIQMYK